MGLHIGFSSSSYDKPRVVYVDNTVSKPTNKFPNPNPKNFKILKSEEHGNYLVIEVNYPDCTNYEGNKILVYNNVELTDLVIKQGSIDPHFSENPNFYSPIARFEPTDRGWQMALLFIDAMHIRDNEKPYCTCPTPYPDTMGEKCRVCFKELR